MIGKLKGRVDSHDDDHLIIDVGGVGYLVFASSRTLAQCGEIGSAVELLIETHVREDHIHLYGFPNSAERDWFRLLTTVQGVGVRMALNILGVFAPDPLTTIIAAQDKKQLTTVSGVGPKLAERIVTELKNKVGKLPTSASIHSFASPGKTPAVGGVNEDAVSALVNLGYARVDAFSAVARIMQREPESSLDMLIVSGLKELAG